MDHLAAPVDVLVAAADAGDQLAWDAIVTRYTPLVWSVCRRFRLAEMEAGDVTQTVWLHLVERLGSVRNPSALPGWLSTTARHECLRVVAARKRVASEVDDETYVDRSDSSGSIDEQLLAVERRAVVRECLAQLPDPCRELLIALSREEHPSYTDISRELARPIGSIGPTRRRCLDRLKRCEALRQWADDLLGEATRV